MIRRINLLKCR